MTGVDVKQSCGSLALTLQLMGKAQEVSPRMELIANIRQRAPFARQQPEAVTSLGRQYATIPALSLEKPNYAVGEDSQHGFEES